MPTRIEFDNHSLNANVRSVGVAPDLTVNGGPASPVIWKTIRHCPFLWRHPFTVFWKLGIELETENGTRRRAEATDTMGGLAHLGDGLRVRAEADGGSVTLRLTTAPGAPGARVRATLDGQPVGEAFAIGAQTKIRLRRALTFFADADKESDLEAREKAFGRRGAGDRFDLGGVAKIRISMIGGQPGPRSEPVSFAAHKRRPETSERGD